MHTLLDLRRPEVINFLTENYEKTAHLILRWNISHAEILNKAQTLNRKETGYTTHDILLADMKAGLPTIIRDHAIAGFHRRKIKPPIRGGIYKKDHSIVKVGPSAPEVDLKLNRPNTFPTIGPVMREVSLEQKNIIWQDMPDFGRAVYLKKRSSLPPEDKYYFPECSSWDYGWRIKDSEFWKNRPSYGRVCKLSRENQNRVGAQPDLMHYNKSDILLVKKCAF